MAVHREAVLFDLDRVLLAETDALKQRIVGLLASKILQLGQVIAQEPPDVLALTWFNEFYKNSGGRIFDQEGFATYVLAKLKTNGSFRENFKHELEALIDESLLDSEAIWVLQELKKKGYELGIWSQGSLIWQKLKAALLGKKVLTETLIFISPNKAADTTVLSQIPAGSIVVDDDLENLLQLKANFAKSRGDVQPPLKLIWLDRQSGYPAPREPGEYQRITALSQLIEFLPNLKRS